MVKITRQFLLRHNESLKIYPARQKNETDEKFLKRITHLRLQGRYFDSLDEITGCDNVTHIYLQSNLFTDIPNLHNFSKLTYLYLQRNKISRLKNLRGLENLQKLYLGYNEISVVEGLENLRRLKELHVEFQDLPMGEMIYIDPRTRDGLGVRLEILNMAGNNLTVLSQISNLHQLKELILTENKITSLEHLAEIMGTWPNLTSISLSKNPVTLRREFKDVLIQKGRRLKYIDGAEVTASTRLFLDGRKQAQLRRERKQQKPGKSISITTQKMVHFQHLEKAHDCLKASSPIATPLTFQPWQIRKNVNCHGPFNNNYPRDLI